MFTKVLFILSLSSFSMIGHSQTSIGNGGDTVDQFLLSTKEQIVSVFYEVQYDTSKRMNYLSFCNETSITSLQRKTCRDFIENTHAELLNLLLSEDSPEYILEFDPIYVKDGNTRRPVAARTEFDPKKPIYFYYDAIKWLSPKRLMALMIHEYIHKVRYKGSPIKDGKTREYPGFRTGRKIIDSVANTYANFAANRGLIVDSYQIMDQFYCAIKTPSSEESGQLGVIGSSPRSFNGPISRPDFNHFTSSIGLNLHDMKVFVEKQDERIELKLEAIHKKGCDPESAYSTTLTLIKQGLDSEVIEEVNFQQKSPVCNPKFAFEISGEDMTFKCQYEGSFGQSSGFLDPN